MEFGNREVVGSWRRDPALPGSGLLLFGLLVVGLVLVQKVVGLF